MRRQLEHIFNAWIANKFRDKREILEYLANHERKQSCINKICDQVMLGEIGQRSAKFDASRYRMLIETAASMFCKIALDYAEERARSRAEIQRRVDEANAVENARQFIEELENEALSTKIISRPGQVAE